MRYESAPKPRLTDAGYRADYLSEKIGEAKRLEWTAAKYFVTADEEPLLDAADVLRFGKDLVVQQYLRGGRGRDLRALVVGGEVVAALRRRAAAGRFARTLRRGARFDAVSLPARHVRLAVEAARVLDLRACAVDMLDEKEGPLVFEVNASPSIREAESACQVDVAARVVACAVALAGPAPRRRGPAK